MNPHSEASIARAVKVQGILTRAAELAPPRKPLSWLWTRSNSEGA